MKRVYSSHIEKIGYRPDSQELHVHYDTGKKAKFKGVPKGIADKVLGAASIGEAMHAHIRNKFPHEYTDD